VPCDAQQVTDCVYLRINTIAQSTHVMPAVIVGPLAPILCTHACVLIKHCPSALTILLCSHDDDDDAAVIM